MSEISALPASIADWLSAQEQLSRMRFVTEYPAEKKAVPLTREIVAVGIDGIDITDSFTENGEGVLERDEYCRRAAIVLRLSIHVPFSAGGAACYDAFTDIIDCLTFASDLEIVTSGCEAITADRDTDAFVLTAKISVNASLCPAEGSSVSFGSFMDKTLLCGSHIRDTDIHLSREQRDYLASPRVTGHYSGNGENTKTVNLGFKPSAVFVCEYGAPPVSVSGGNASAHFAFAIPGYGSEGISLTANGFRIDTSAGEISYGCAISLNETGSDYFFTALR